MRLKPLVITLVVIQILLVAFQAHALMTGKVNIVPEVVKNLREFLIDIRSFAAIDPSFMLKKQEQHSDLPPEIQAELAAVSYRYNAHALDGVKGKFREMSVIFQNPFAAPEEQMQLSSGLHAAASEPSRLAQSPPPSLHSLRQARKQARAVIPNHLKGPAQPGEYDVAFNKVTAPKRTGNKPPLR